MKYFPIFTLLFSFLIANESNNIDFNRIHEAYELFFSSSYRELSAKEIKYSENIISEEFKIGNKFTTNELIKFQKIDDRHFKIRGIVFTEIEIEIIPQIYNYPNKGISYTSYEISNAILHYAKGQLFDGEIEIIQSPNSEDNESVQITSDQIKIFAKLNRIEKFNSKYIEDVTLYSGSDLRCFKQDSKYGFKIKNEIIIIPPIYDEVIEFSEELCPVCINDKWGFINIKGNIVIPLIYENAKIHSSGLAPVCLNGKWGYIDQKGKMAIVFQFDFAGLMVNNCATVNKNGIKYMINEKGEPWK